MLRNIQIKVVLIFLVIGIVVIGALGYINYAEMQKLTNGLDSEIILHYQSQIKFTTIVGIGLFSAICVVVRYFCNKSDYCAS